MAPLLCMPQWIRCLSADRLIVASLGKGAVQMPCLACVGKCNKKIQTILKIT